MARLFTRSNLLHFKGICVRQSMRRFERSTIVLSKNGNSYLNQSQRSLFMKRVRIEGGGGGGGRGEEEETDDKISDEEGHCVFLSNVAFKATEEELHHFLNEKVGSCERIELKRDSNGASKGLAIAIFRTATALQTALKHDRIIFAGRPLFISPYQPVPQAHRERIAKQILVFPLTLPQSLT